MVDVKEGHLAVILAKDKEDLQNREQGAENDILNGRVRVVTTSMYAR